MTSKRSKTFLLGLAALMGSSALTAGCVVHDRHGYGYSRSYHSRGVYYATPRYETRRTTHYYKAPRHPRGDHRDWDRRDRDRDGDRGWRDRDDRRDRDRHWD